MEAFTALFMLVAAVGTYALFFGYIGWKLGSEKGRGTAGIVWSLLLGFIGWIIVLLLPPTVEAEALRERKLEAARRRV